MFSIERTDISDFYDAIASFYDDMTGTRNRIGRDEPLFKEIVDSHHIHEALDAGTGSGALALTLARLGVNVTGIDLAPAMIERLARNAADLALSVTGMVLPMQDLPLSMNDSYDAVFCLGNTFPHLRTDEERQAAIRGFFRVLRPGGLLFLQFLNFDFPRPDTELPRFLTQVRESTMERHYESTAEGVRLVIQRREESHSAARTFHLDLRPVHASEIRALLESVGFTAITISADLTGGAWDPKLSKDIVVKAKKDA